MKRIITIMLLLTMVSTTSCGYKLVKVDESEPATSTTTSASTSRAQDVEPISNTPEETEIPEGLYDDMIYYDDAGHRIPYSDPDMRDLPTFDYSFFKDIGIDNEEMEAFYAEHNEEFVRFTNVTFREDKSVPVNYDEGTFGILVVPDPYIFVIWYDDFTQSLFSENVIVEGSITYDPSNDAYFIIEGTVNAPSVSIQDRENWTLLDLGEAYGNEVRFKNEHYAGEPMFIPDVWIEDLREVAADFRDSNFRLFTGVYLNKDIYSSGMYDFNEGDYVTVFGYLDGVDTGSVGSLKLVDCEVIAYNHQSAW